MRPIAAFAACATLALSTPLLAQDIPAPGIWTNTEDEYFAEEEGRQKPAWLALEIAADGRWRWIDAFGKALSEWTADPIPGLAEHAGGGWQIAGSELRRAHAFRCWVSVRKFAGKPDGGEDWTFTANFPIFDQGGRIFVSGKGQAPDVTIRLRTVTWARGSRNKPSLVLYVHKDEPERAVSYAWASPDAGLVGINLRWIQASCSREEE